jgi:hypothetical protein
MELQGKIKAIGQTAIFGSNGFAKREIVVTTEEQYPQVIAVEFVQDKCNLLDAFQVGQAVKIGINLRGREWVNPQGETKYFNTIAGWRIDALAAGGQATAKPNAAAAPAPTQFAPATDLNEEDYDDLPF